MLDNLNLTPGRGRKLSKSPNLVRSKKKKLVKRIKKKMKKKIASEEKTSNLATKARKSKKKKKIIHIRKIKPKGVKDMSSLDLTTSQVGKIRQNLQHVVINTESLANDGNKKSKFNDLDDLDFSQPEICPVFINLSSDDELEVTQMSSVKFSSAKRGLRKCSTTKKLKKRKRRSKKKK